MNLINDWIISDKCFHIIRDNLSHGTEILGGLFGVKVKEFKKLSKNKNFKSINFYKERYYKLFDKNVEEQPDQHFLRELVWPIIKNNNMTHISDENVRYSKDDILIPKSANFCGDAIFNPTYDIN